MRNASANIGRTLLAAQAKQDLRTATTLLLVLVPIAGLCYWLFIPLQARIRQDVAESVPQQTVGRIASVIAYSKVPSTARSVIVRIGDQSYVASCSPLIGVGEQVQVSYRRGRSGILHIDRIEPLIGSR